MKVYVLFFSVDYEGSLVHKVYLSKKKAEREKKKLDNLQDKFFQECLKTDYDTNMKSPNGFNCEKIISEFEVIK